MDNLLQINQEVLITIKRIGINGEGIGYYKRLAVFVDGVIPPEEVVVKITKIQKTYANAEVVRIKKKAFYRTKPFCQHYQVCGGCQLQHVNYEEQQRLKEASLKQSFERYTTLDLAAIKFYPFSPLVNTSHYRHKASMPVRNTKDGIVTGLYKKDSQDLVDVLYCPVQDKDINRVNQEVLKILDTHDIQAFDPTIMRGLVRYIVTRKSSHHGDIQVTLVVTIYNHALKSAAKDIINIPSVKSVYISKNHDVNNHAIFGETVELLEGRETIQETMGDILYDLGPKAFYQLNPEEAAKMYESIDTLFDDKDQNLLDLYTGSGAMALYFAKRFKNVIGIDLSVESIESAKNNAKINDLSHVKFVAGDAYQTLKTLYDQNHHFDVAVFDPPRTGLDKDLIDLMLRKPIKKLIYVSCNPSTLAKNIKLLSRKYNIVSVRPFDMFPQTAHVESVTLLSLKTA